MKNKLIRNFFIKKKKIFTSILIGSILITSMPVAVMARNFTEKQVIESKINNDFNFTESEVRKILKDTYEMEDKDIDNLLEEFPLTNENIDHGMMTFYSSPKVGDVKYNVYTYDKEEFVRIATSLKIAVNGAALGLGLSKSEWSSVLIKAFGWKVIVAGAIAGVAAGLVYYNFSKYKTAKIRVKYTWAYWDNAMTYNWMLTGAELLNYTT